ncbi:MAG: DUF6338 family protein [Solirubrobacteraceae bacterium]
MIPGTLLGALFLAACLVPGFIFLQIAERRRAQPSRSNLLEAVELTGVGAATSLIAATLVLLGSRWLEVVDVSALLDDPGRYLLLHPARGLGPMLVTFGLSCVLAWAAGRLLFVRRESVFHPGSTAWIEAMWDARPSEGHFVLVTVELIDGRRVAGLVRGFTTELDDNREIALHRPIGAQANQNTKMVETGDDFLVLREKQIASIAGRYIPPAAASDPKGSPVRSEGRAPCNGAHTGARTPDPQ